MSVLVKYILLLTMSTLFCAFSAHAQEKSAVFNSAEFRSTELNAFKKWAGLRERHQKDQKPFTRNRQKETKTTCRKDEYFNCVGDQWHNIMQSVRNETQITKMKTINSHLNKAAYVTDMINWQQKDYWATIQQFFQKDGDCEDYAIAKYYSLKELGFDPDKMRIVIVQDNNLNIPHAVLAVYLDGKIWILDNQISGILTDDRILHYTPLYSINEKAWWLHKTS